MLFFAAPLARGLGLGAAAAGAEAGAAAGATVGGTASGAAIGGGTVGCEKLNSGLGGCGTAARRALAGDRPLPGRVTPRENPPAVVVSKLKVTGAAAAAAAGASMRPFFPNPAPDMMALFSFSASGMPQFRRAQATNDAGAKTALPTDGNNPSGAYLT